MSRGVNINGTFQNYNEMLSLRNDRKLKHVMRKSKLNDLLDVSDAELDKLVRRCVVMKEILDMNPDMQTKLFNYLSNSILLILIDIMLYNIYPKTQDNPDLRFRYDSVIHHKKIHGSKTNITKLHNEVLVIYKDAHGLKMSDSLNL